MALENLKKLVTEGEPDGAVEEVQKAMNDGVDVLTILNDAMVPGINRAGELWKEDVYFLPDVIMSAEAFKDCMSIIEPKLKTVGSEKIGKVVIGCVEGDMHDLGKELVVAMLRANGFEVVDLGPDVPVSKFVESIKVENPDIVGMGAYMSTTMTLMKDFIETFVKEGVRDKIKVMVGGVPITQKYSEDVGADAWGQDALDAVEKAKKLMGVA